MLTATLFIIAPMWKHLQTKEWVHKMCCVHTQTHTHTGILLSHEGEGCTPSARFPPLFQKGDWITIAHSDNS